MKGGYNIMTCLFFTIIFLLLRSHAEGIRQEVLSQEKHVVISIVNNEDMAKPLKQYPNSKEITGMRRKLPKEYMLNPKGWNMITYTLGTGRVSGDTIVGSETISNDFGAPTNITATLKYPSSGTGANVTYVKINVYQSSEEGRAYVISGGIGLNYIVIVIEADKTDFFDSYASIYGIQ